MREIKFRAWDKEYCEMVLVDRINFREKEIEIVTAETKATEEYYTCDFEDIELMQYTGLKDKKGKEIYEGDIIKCKMGQREFDAIVEFGNPNSYYSWGWQLNRITGNSFNMDILLWVETELDGIECTIIGNIYENPELLVMEP